MYCSDCEYLNDKKPKKGGIDGCVYECKKLKKMVHGNFSCDKFSKSYSRKYYDKDRIYTEGRKFSDTPKGNPISLVILLVLLLVLAIIFGILN